MKWNWGTGITLVIVLFIGAILGVVYMAMNERVDLVRDDYYEQELRHQERINEVVRTRADGATPTIVASSGIVVISFPATVEKDSLAGSVQLYRPADRTQDRKVALELDASNTQSISTARLMPGMWRVKIQWTSASQRFYHEDVVMIP